MYKLTLDPPEGNFITEIVDRKFIKVEAKVLDKRNLPKDCDDLNNLSIEEMRRLTIYIVLFIEETSEKLWDRVARICDSYGYKLCYMFEPESTTYTYDVGKAYIMSKTK